MAQQKVRKERINLEVLTKGRVKKMLMDDCMDYDLKTHISPEQLRERMLACLESGGRVYTFQRQREMVAYFLFEKEVTEGETLYVNPLEAFDQNAEVKKGDNKPQTIIKLEDYYVLPTFSNQMEKMKSDILQELKEYCVMEEYSAIKWGEETIVQKAYKFGKGYLLGLPFGLGIGMLFGLAMDNIALGICLGVCFALVYSGAWTTVSNSKKKQS